MSGRNPPYGGGRSGSRASAYRQDHHGASYSPVASSTQTAPTPVTAPRAREMPTVPPQRIDAFRGKRRIRILSVDGGGVRGLVPAMIIEELERLSGRRACDMFDLVAGTSTGAIIAAMVGLPATVGSSRPSNASLGSQMVKLYMTRGVEIFPSPQVVATNEDVHDDRQYGGGYAARGDVGRTSPVPDATRGGGFDDFSPNTSGSTPTRKRDLLARNAVKLSSSVRTGWNTVRAAVHGAKYSHKGLESILVEYCLLADREVSLADMIVPVYIPAVEMGQGLGCVFFSSLDAQHDGSANGCNYRLADVLRASTAAPTFLPCKRLRNCVRQPNGSLVSGNVDLTCIDGGVNCNNPALSALLYVRSIVGPDVDIELVSIGTGQIQESHSEEDMTSYGAAQWIRPLIQQALNGTSHLAHTQLRMIAAGDKRLRYTRLQLDIPKEYTSETTNRTHRSQGIAVEQMDNVRKENLNALYRLVAERFIPERRADFVSVVKRL